jgi:hypothetical protein
MQFAENKGEAMSQENSFAIKLRGSVPKYLSEVLVHTCTGRTMLEPKFSRSVSDADLSSYEDAIETADQLRQAGYRLDVVHVGIPC